MLHVKTQSRIAQTLMKEQTEPLNAVACHPKHPVVAMGSYSGMLKVWDYERKVTVCSKILHADEQIHCITYDPQGVWVCHVFYNNNGDQMRALKIQTLWRHLNSPNNEQVHFVFKLN